MMKKEADRREAVLPSARRIGRPRLLIVGCGDVGMRLLPFLRDRYRVFAVTSRPERREALRDAGAVPIVADLDQPHTLARLARLAPVVLHLAPPQSDGERDRRTRRLIAILPEGTVLVYVSTTGVYGDCHGEFFDETRPVAPRNARAKRRVDAERVLRRWGRHGGRRAAILRVPGIYAGDRLPVERLARGTPALRPEDDVHTNHVHADDLARIVVAALQRATPQRVYHAVDDTRMTMGEYFDTVADASGLPRPPRLPRAELEKIVSPVQLSFMSESRRLDNRRMKTELGVQLRHPDVTGTLATLATPAAMRGDDPDQPVG